MAKLAILCAVMVLVLALAAEASIYRTTITTTVEEENPNQGGRGSQSQRCMQQMHQQRQQLQHCQRYLSMQRSFDSVLALNTDENQQQTRHLQQCCQALGNIQDEQCRCEAVRQAFQQTQGGGGWGGQGGGQQMQEQMRQRARFLPRKCNVGPQECQV